MFKRRAQAVLLSAAMLTGTISPAISVMAAGSGTWVKSGDLYWYKNPDGSWPANKWAKINGKWYHFNENGYMQSGWKKLDGHWYYLGSKNDGSMKTGWINVNGTYYYLDSSGIMLTGWRTINGKSYYFWSDGSMAKNTTIDGYKVGADGAWIQEESKPVQEQKPSLDPNLSASLDPTILALFKEEEKFPHEDPLSWSPRAIDIRICHQIFSNKDLAEAYKNSGIYENPNDTDENKRLFTDLYYAYLTAAGFDINQSLKQSKEDIYQMAKAVQISPYLYTAEELAYRNLSGNGFRYYQVESFIQSMINEGLLSSDFIKTYASKL